MAAALVQTFQFLLLLGALLTAVKLCVTGLRHRYRFFFWYLAFLVGNSTWPLLLDRRSQLYLKLYVCTEPVVWILSVLVVREIYRLILEKHRGLYTLGRWAMYASVAASVVLSILALLPKITPATHQASRVLGYLMAVERGVDLSLPLFIILILLFLSLYPVPLSRNVLVHAVVFACYFLSTTLALILRAVFGLQLITELAVLFAGTSAGCTLAWFFLLTAKGEEVRISLPWLGPEHESRLLTQLDALNATLLRASRD